MSQAGRAELHGYPVVERHRREPTGLEASLGTNFSTSSKLCQSKSRVELGNPIKVLLVVPEISFGGSAAKGFNHSQKICQRRVQILRAHSCHVLFHHQQRLASAENGIIQT